VEKEGNGTVLGIDAHGNVLTNLQESDLEVIGKQFYVQLGSSTAKVEVGDDFYSVKEGEAVAFKTAYNLFMLAVNGGTLEKKLGKVNVGDTLRVFV